MYKLIVLTFIFKNNSDKSKCRPFLVAALVRPHHLAPPFIQCCANNIFCCLTGKNQYFHQL